MVDLDTDSNVIAGGSRFSITQLGAGTHELARADPLVPRSRDVLGTPHYAHRGFPGCKRALGELGLVRGLGANLEAVVLGGTEYLRENVRTVAAVPNQPHQVVAGAGGLYG